MRKVKKEEMAGLKYVVSGAEKLPPKFAEAFHEKFGLNILEGYGLTETSPASNANLPDPVSDGHSGQSAPHALARSARTCRGSPSASSIRIPEQHFPQTLKA